METITIPKKQFENMEMEISILRNSKIYKRLLEFEENISKGEKHSREELEF